MKNVFSFALAFAVIIAIPDSRATVQDDAAKFIALRGAKISDVKPIAQSPDSDVIPVIYYEKGKTVQSCGLFIDVPGKQHPDFFELSSPDPGASFPQCLNITAIVPFKLQDKNYITVEYISRETREDNYRIFDYLFRDTERGFVEDQALTNAVPNIKTTIAEALPTPAKQLDSIKAARLAYMTKAFPEWRLERRDFISDANSSFAVFEDKKNGQCYLAAEAGGKPVVAGIAEYARDGKCVGVLASSRLVRPNITYFLEILKTASNRQLVCIMSVSADGAIKIEKTLSEKVNRAGATRDMKTAKAALADALQQ